MRNRVLTTVGRHWQAIARASSAGGVLCVRWATYGINTNPVAIQGFKAVVSAANTAQIRLLIGQQNANCEAIDAVRFLSELYSDGHHRVKVCVAEECHLKCVTFEYRGRAPLAIIGGRNLGVSTWADLSYVVVGPDALRINKLFDSVWRKGAVFARTATHHKPF